MATKKEAWDKSALLYVRRGFSDNVLPCQPLKLRKLGGSRLVLDPKVVRGSDEIAKVLREGKSRRLKGGMW